MAIPGQQYEIARHQDETYLVCLSFSAWLFREVTIISRVNIEGKTRVLRQMFYAISYGDTYTRAVAKVSEEEVYAGIKEGTR